jgi:hypothetical protein
MSAPKTIIETAKSVGQQLTQPAPPPLTEDELKRACAGVMKK